MRVLAPTLAFLLVSITAASQNITHPVADAPTVNLTTDKTFAAGDPVVLYSGASKAGCNETFGVRVSAPGSAVGPASPTAIKIQGKLSEGDFVCGIIRHGIKDTVIAAVLIAPADPAIAPAPAVGDLTVQVVNGGKVAGGDPILLFSGPSSLGCDETFGTRISVAGSALAAASTTTIIKLQSGLAAGAYVCGIAKDAAGLLKILPVAVVAPNLPTISPAPSAGDTTVKVVTTGASAPGDVVGIYMAATASGCDAVTAAAPISVAGSVLASASPTTVSLTAAAKLVAGNFVCGQITHAQQPIVIKPVQIAAAAAPIAPAPVAPPAPVAGAAPISAFTVTLNNPTNVSIKDPTVGAASVDLYTVPVTGPCTKAAGTPIALAVPGSNSLPAGVATLSLAKPLAPGTILCAIDSTSAPSPIYVYIQPRQPVFTKPPFEGSALLGVQATPSDSATTPVWTVNVQLLRLLTETDPCDTSHGSAITLAGGTLLTSQPTDKLGSAAFTIAPPLAAGSYVCALQTITVNAAGVKQLPLVDPQIANGSTTPILVDSQTDWGLVRAYFTGGTVISNDSSNFSSANLFFDLNVDKTWIMPSCADCASSQFSRTSTISLDADSDYTLTGKEMVILNAVLSGNELHAAGDAASGVVISGHHLILTRGGKPESVSGTIRVTSSIVEADPDHLPHIRGGQMTVADGRFTIKGSGSMIVSRGHPRGRISHSYVPGLNTFFDARLTSIPVASNPTNTSTSTTTTTGTATTTPPPSTAPSFISDQKTARIGVGVYLPVLLTRWEWNKAPNALFIAPMAKIGFDTITQAQQQNVILPGGTVGTQTYSQLYNYRTFGARIGHMKLSGSSNKAPEIYSYLDIGFGPFSNLESLICKRTRYTADTPAKGTHPAIPGVPLPGEYAMTNYADSQCKSTYPRLYVAPDDGSTDVFNVYETRKRIYRLDLEGLLKIPGTPIYVGFNANLGQKQLKAGNFDPQFKAPDDLRFFFGTKFDISTFLNKMGANIGN